MIGPGELLSLLQRPEDEHLEFKEATVSFSEADLFKYCAALANERGGRFVLGITDRRPRSIVGSKAFLNVAEVKNKILRKLSLRVEVSELFIDSRRILVFEIPGRPLGFPIAVDGAYWMRSGESVVAMTQDQLQSIFREAETDYSAAVCPAAQVGDLDSEAIQIFRARWHSASGLKNVAQRSDAQVLADAELVSDRGITFAALVLLGTHEALGKHLGQSELVFEYRAAESKIPHQQRLEWRKGFLLYSEELWKAINSRNEIQSFRNGLFRQDILTFSERSVREAILNAVCHRDYRLGGSIFIRQYPRKLEIVSPGGFPLGISAENIIDQQFPRNRRLAEALTRCGLVERSGQGVDTMFEEAIRESKRRPDYSGSDEYQVRLELDGTVRHPEFLSFLEQIGQERLEAFSVEDFLLLDLINAEQQVPPRLQLRLPALVELGVIERLGIGKNRRYILSRRFYRHLGRTGVYTRQRGLDHDTKKMLLLQHIQGSGAVGAQRRDLTQVLPQCSPAELALLLRELRGENRIELRGRTKGSRWLAYTPPAE